MTVLVSGLAAQAPRYERIDTVMKPYFQFDYKAWIDTDATHPLAAGCESFYMPLRGIDGDVTLGRTIFGDILQYNYVDEPTDVYGLSYYYYGHVPGVPSYRPPSPPPFQEYFYLYEAEPDTFCLMEQVPLDYSIPVCGTDTIVSRLNDSFTCGAPLYDGARRRYYRRDFYFSKPVRVRDSFYVGMSHNSGRNLVVERGYHLRGFSDKLWHIVYIWHEPFGWRQRASLCIARLVLLDTEFDEVLLEARRA